MLSKAGTAILRCQILHLLGGDQHFSKQIGLLEIQKFLGELLGVFSHVFFCFYILAVFQRSKNGSIFAPDKNLVDFQQELTESDRYPGIKCLYRTHLVSYVIKDELGNLITDRKRVFLCARESFTDFCLADFLLHRFELLTFVALVLPCLITLRLEPPARIV